MNIEKFPFKLYLVTDEAACLGRDFFWVLEEALKAGVDLVQLREKNLPAELFVDKAKRCMEICSRYEVPLIINDLPEVAEMVMAQGIHVGQQDISIEAVKCQLGKDFPVGLSLDRREDLTANGAESAWYYGVSPIFTTPTKSDTLGEWGLEGLGWLRGKTKKPLVAIGNINPQNAANVISNGADCLAVVSAICSAPSPGKAAASFIEAITKATSR
ncbi:thiamine phosphate synthase [Lunatibacter salilacus]|uniref:thiamine phosphate synthase n=1 Tax=Lunatibacter salilacus TaxID=2483804 RepID=UPI00131E2E72|nr:thiamine phosphate synthase [Lunatibacter salilacus]